MFREKLQKMFFYFCIPFSVNCSNCRDLFQLISFYNFLLSIFLAYLFFNHFLWRFIYPKARKSSKRVRLFTFETQNLCVYSLWISVPLVCFRATIRREQDFSRKENSSKTKSISILCLSDSVLAITRAIWDDYCKSSNAPWDSLKRMLTISSQQGFIDLQYRLNTTILDAKSSWDCHISQFMSIIDNLASDDQEVTEV